jgi:hypothetical protein
MKPSSPYFSWTCKVTGPCANIIRATYLNITTQEQVQQAAAHSCIFNGFYFSNPVIKGSEYSMGKKRVCD